MNKTDRGFPIKEFEDYYENKCSLQMSSLATQEAVWLGIANPKVQIMNQPGWEDYEFPEEVLISSRMHLTRGMVAKLLPYLQSFVDTGELEDPDPLLEKALEVAYKEDKMKIGDKVAYIKYDGSYDNGIIKSFGTDNTVFVVYNCAGEWDNYQDYTSARTDIHRLVYGWRE